MIRFSTLGLGNRKYFWLSVVSKIAFSESCRWLFAQPHILSSQARTGDLYSAEIQDAHLQTARAVCLSTCPLALSPVYFICLGLSRYQFLTPVIGHIPPCLVISELRSGSGNCLQRPWPPGTGLICFHSPVLKNCCFSCFIYFKNCFKREGLSNPCYSILAGSESPQVLQFFSLFFHIHPQAPSSVHTRF